MVANFLASVVLPVDSGPVKRIFFNVANLHGADWQSANGNFGKRIANPLHLKKVNLITFEPLPF